MADSLGANILAHLHKLRCTISVNGFYNRFGTLEVAECLKRVVIIPVTNRISHRKSSGIIVKCQAILLSIDALTVGVLRHHVIASNGFAESGRTGFALS